MNRETSIHDLLERILLDENEEPTKLPMWLLESITNNFSEDMKIGDGGFAYVYKGVFRNFVVAVKKLKQSEMVDLQETKFIQEVDNLMRVKHKNIVRFLGYCSDTQGNMQKHQGKNIMAEERQRFLCFEFMPKGSLDKYVSDASSGLEWRTRYRIIKGICKGLHYLHEEKIVHLDLKPANILLDNNMVPKIADFGLAKCFDEDQTRARTLNVCGSLGYMAPECFSGVITFKSDIYSLGIIITEILTGQKLYLQKENVLESWSTRFQRSKEGTWLELVKVCAEICTECLEFDPVKRPITLRIIERLDELERACGFIEMSHPTPHASASIAWSGSRQPRRPEKPGSGAAEVESGSDVDGKLVHFDRPLAFTADDLLFASTEIMGKSTYGMLYKATLEDGSLVAVKRLEEKITKGDKEFEAEAAMLGRVCHPNLLALRAYYLTRQGKKLLVFDYMPKGSLSKFLHARGPNTLVDWATRMTIAKGIARGLAYLHDDMSIVHGNLTASNVLLDEQNNPKISGFGLSRLMTTAANLNMPVAADALGYRAPELSKLKKANAKTDVYSLGMIILQLLAGKSPIGGTNGMDLPQWVAFIVREEWKEVFDLELMRNTGAGPVRHELMLTLKLALHCVCPEPSVRPEAWEVLRQLGQIVMYGYS